MRRPTARVVPLVALGERSTVLSSAARLPALTHQRPRGSPSPAGPHHASRARKRKEATKHHVHMYSTVQTPAETQTQTCLPLCLWGRGHVTVAVTAPALFPTVQYHSRNLCPEEEPLSSFGFAPPSSPSNGDGHTNAPSARVQCGLQPLVAWR